MQGQYKAVTQGENERRLFNVTFSKAETNWETSQHVHNIFVLFHESNVTASCLIIRISLLSFDVYLASECVEMVFTGVVFPTVFKCGPIGENNEKMRFTFLDTGYFDLWCHCFSCLFCKCKSVS